MTIYIIFEAGNLQVSKAFRMFKVLVCLRLHNNSSVKNNQLQFYFPKNKNSTHQTGRVIYDFHLPDGLDIRIGQRASANFKPCGAGEARRGEGGGWGAKEYAVVSMVYHWDRDLSNGW